MNGSQMRYSSRRKILIVGNPNVGKSVLFNALAREYATVSNYPGTTVEVLRGTARIKNEEYEVTDTPGTYSLYPITEEERVARRILLAERPDIVIHVVDAKNLERMLPFTLQLLEAALPVMLVLNIMDEAEKEGIAIDVNLLAEKLRIPVAAAVATTGKGLDILADRICRYQSPEDSSQRVALADGMEKAIKAIMPLLPENYSQHISRRTIALLLLSQDEEIGKQVRERMPQNSEQISRIVRDTQAQYHEPLAYHIAIRNRQASQHIAEETITMLQTKPAFKERLSRLMLNPITGFPILLAVLYWGLYRFVGGFGAGTVVDFLEGTVFEQYINPAVSALCSRIIPWRILQDLIAGEYGIVTLGVRYAAGIILPIVTFFFLVFSLIEDTGYLPRLAMLIDRIFKGIGLSGRAVIPMVLGLGCATMATMVTRTLPTRRERLIATLLLALAVPCSAQLGVILALLEGRPKVMLVWAGAVMMIFLAVGYLSARVLPGTPPSFYMELPPLRLPKLSNILTKTYIRVKWYFKEILPLFLLASVIIWLGQLTRLFDFLVFLLLKPIKLMGLPPVCSKVFLFGFFRRDYGAAGLYDLNKQALLNNVQIAVACVALTLFLPCIAQFLMNIKERGWKTGLLISGTALVISFGAGCLLNFILVATKAVL